MYTSQVPEYRIDLRRPAQRRWDAVIKAERRMLRRVASTTIEGYAQYPQLMRQFAGALFAALYETWGGRHVGEIKALAEGCGVSSGELLLGNCLYELSHALDARGDGLMPWVTGRLGCTTGIRQFARRGPVHVRSMDWAMPVIGEATRLFRFHDGKREFVSVGILGFVGVLSGMVPGAYSVTINWAPPIKRPTFDWGPSFLLREVLETCDSYEQAVGALKDAALSTSVFYTVCGAEDGQACVIERTAGDASVRRMRGPVLVQANHHASRRFARHNRRIEDGDEKTMSLLEDSTDRAGTLEAALAALPATATVMDAAACLDEPPVLNTDSYQQMVFVPRTGQVTAWRKVRARRRA